MPLRAFPHSRGGEPVSGLSSPWGAARRASSPRPGQSVVGRARAPLLGPAFLNPLEIFNKRLDPSLDRLL